MAATRSVKLAEGRDGTPAERQVPRILVVKAAGAGAKVERCTCKYTVNEVTLKPRVCLEEGAEVLGVVVVEAERPC